MFDRIEGTASVSVGYALLVLRTNLCFRGNLLTEPACGESWLDDISEGTTAEHLSEENGCQTNSRQLNPNEKGLNILSQNQLVKRRSSRIACSASVGLSLAPFDFATVVASIFRIAQMRAHVVRNKLIPR